ncbi:MAG: aminoglycoside 3'-phosphotransferase [Ruminococcaceae bacterium]|nr:aminoglycoside 3'-phosphotransferase [Oscillospiraceae bacterium]
MVRRPIQINTEDYPEKILSYLEDAKLYDSSCSPFAKVIFIDKNEGFYLKTAEKGTLKREADMTGFFAAKGLSSEVVEYISLDRDYMLTRKISGEDCTYYRYTEQPEKLCDTLATLLRKLHGESFEGCPVPDHTAVYLDTVEKNYKNKCFDLSYLDSSLGKLNADEVYKYVFERKHLLKSDTLLHGDYCLPNILLDDFVFSGFIDVGNGGIGDRHVDLFWGAWTLNFNLKTDKYRNRFFDAYGKNLVDLEIIKLISAIECFG